MRRVVFAAAACLAATLGTLPAGAQEVLPGIDTSRQWTIERIGTDHWKLTGDVEVEREDMKFYADEMEIFTDTNTLLARGNVVFTNATARVAADSVEFNLKTKLGVFHHASGSSTLGDPREKSRFGTQEADMYFYGETLEKVGDQKYRITKGGFTTCVQPTPRWELTSGSVVLNIDHYAVLKNSLFRVKGVPVLFLPIIYYPINKEDRSTGFLLPTYGTSSLRGQSLSNAFFWAISRSQDATFLYDWFSKAGQGLGTQYRYVASQTSAGDARFYVLKQKPTSYVSGGTPVTLAGHRSFELRGNANQDLPANLKARVRFDYFSDVTVQQTFNTNIYDASRRQRYYGGTVSGAWGAYSTVATLDRSEYFFDSRNSTLNGSMPRLAVTRSERPLFGSPIYFQVGGEYASIVRETRASDKVSDFGLHRFDTAPTIRFPFRKWQFFTVNSSLTWHYTWWSQSRDPLTGAQAADPLHRTYIDMQARIVGPVFNRIWNPNSRYAEKIKHAIEPYVNLQRVSAVDNFNRIIQLDSTDSVVGSTTRITYGLNNRIYAKRKGGDGPAQAREIINVGLKQTFYTDALAAQYDPNYSTSFQLAPPAKFSPLSIQVRAVPADRVNGSLRIEYDTKFTAIRTISAVGTWNPGEWMNLNMGWSQRRYVQGLSGFNNPNNASHYLNSAADFHFRQNRYGGTVSFNYDIAHRSFLQKRFTGYYNAQCCGFGVEYQNYNFGSLTSAVQQDRRFNISITLAGIGTFSNIFGAFGGNQGYR